MPVTYAIVDDGRLVIERWVGTIAQAEFLSHERGKLQDTSIVSGAKVLADARTAEFSETTTDLIEQVAGLYDHPDLRGRIATHAAVFGGKDFGMAKAWETELRRHGVNTIVFNNLEVACIWLGIDPAETQKQLDALGE